MTEKTRFTFLSGSSLQFVIFFALFSCVTSAKVDQSTPNNLPKFFYGVTIDSIDKLAATKASLSKLNQKVFARVVFDEEVEPEEYKEFVGSISEVSYVMGEILDSFYVKDVTTEQYLDRVKKYYESMKDSVHLWEIGNEVNGDWLGNQEELSKKLNGAYEYIHSQNALTAITLYLNEGCEDKNEHLIFPWVEKRLSKELKDNIDYVFVSYYEDDCKGSKPDYQELFQKLGEVFPNSYLGMGEVGTKKRNKKEDHLRKYYQMRVDHPRYVGGYFWWYFRQDMVPNTRPLWNSLNRLITPPKTTGR